MKKLLAITGVILTAYVLLTSAVNSGVRAPAADAAQYGVTAAESVITIADHEGRVAVFRDGRLDKVTDTPTASLPKADRARLSEGIKVNSDKELKEMLEDLCS